MAITTTTGVKCDCGGAEWIDVTAWDVPAGSHAVKCTTCSAEETWDSTFSEDVAPAPVSLVKRPRQAVRV